MAGSFVYKEMWGHPELDSEVEATSGDAVWVERVPQVEPSAGTRSWRYAEAEVVRFDADLQFLAYLEQINRSINKSVVRQLIRRNIVNIHES